MIDDDKLYAQLPYVLKQSNFTFLGTKYEGKVRDSYSQGDKLYLVTTDRLSCFDKVVTTVPFKGQVLQGLAVSWFEMAKDIIANHILDIPDPNVMLVKNCQIVPVEVVVRAYLAGSAWRDYEAGRAISGVKLPSGMKASQRLPQVIITPSTKAPRGQHDEPISEEEIIKRNILPKEIWQQIREAALQLFALGEEVALRQGLLLVDTKYEFGMYEGKLLLADEIHTLDSSRFWVKDSYQSRFEAGQSPEMLDKEPTRQWLISKGYMGDGEIPLFTDEHRVQIAKHYISSYERILGQAFHAEVGVVIDRIEKTLL